MTDAERVEQLEQELSKQRTENEVLREQLKEALAALEWHNNGTEQDLRNTCVHRKVSGGTRSEAGSHAYAHNASVVQTLRKNFLPLTAWMTQTCQTFLQGLPLPTVFAPH